MACTEHGERHSSMSHCRQGEVSSRPLCASCVLSGLAVSFFASDGVSGPSVCLRLRVCGRACVCARACIMAPGRGKGGACLAGRLAQLLSSCLRQPLGQSGLSGKPPLERHQSRHARVGGRKKRAKKLRMSREEPELWDQDAAEPQEQKPSHFVWFLIEAWRRINPAVLFKQNKGNGFSKNVLREYILMEAFPIRH